MVCKVVLKLRSGNQNTNSKDLLDLFFLIGITRSKFRNEAKMEAIF